MAAVGSHFFDVHFVDDVVDLLAGSDNPDLRSVAMRICQQFVELCGHDSCLILGMVEGLEAMAYPTTFMNKVCDRLRSSQPSPVIASQIWVSRLVVRTTLLAGDLASSPGFTGGCTKPVRE